MLPSILKFHPSSSLLHYTTTSSFPTSSLWKQYCSSITCIVICFTFAIRCAIVVTALPHIHSIDTYHNYDMFRYLLGILWLACLTNQALSQSLPPILVRGSKFFSGGKQFFVKGKHIFVLPHPIQTLIHTPGQSFSKIKSNYNIQVNSDIKQNQTIIQVKVTTSKAYLNFIMKNNILEHSILANTSKRRRLSRRAYRPVI